jgi:hypothetical protein
MLRQGGDRKYRLAAPGKLPVGEQLLPVKTGQLRDQVEHPMFQLATEDHPVYADLDLAYSSDTAIGIGPF